MAELLERGRLGRPSGKVYGIAVRAYDSQEGVELMQRLAENRGVSVAALLRILVREEAARRGIGQNAWASAATRLREHYETSSEVADWQNAEDGYIE
ncbi:MAG: hypothetical protein ACO1SX_18525 [Actinomycetota bacterium]